MFKLAAIATIATYAVAQNAAPESGPSKEEIKKMLGPKCTRGTDEEVEKKMQDETKMAAKMLECDADKIDDVMCPGKKDMEAFVKKQEEATKAKDFKVEDGEKMIKEATEMGM